MVKPIGGGNYNQEKSHKPRMKGPKKAEPVRKKIRAPKRDRNKSG